MMWLFVRGVIFTVLVPGTVTVWLPVVLYNRDRAAPEQLGWIRELGWIPIAIGVALYLWSTAEFLVRGRGTPAIFFTRPVRFLWGEEPQVLVEGSIYRYVRNPMYLGVVTVLFGEALLFASPNLLWYAFTAWLFFYFIIVFVEEPHLRDERGEKYTQYCRDVPRWIPIRSRRLTD